MAGRFAKRPCNQIEIGRVSNHDANSRDLDLDRDSSWGRGVVRLRDVGGDEPLDDDGQRDQRADADRDHERPALDDKIPDRLDFDRGGGRVVTGRRRSGTAAPEVMGRAGIRGASPM